MTPPQFERTEILIGAEGVARLAACHVFLAGLGGSAPGAPRRWHAQGWGG